MSPRFRTAAVIRACLASSALLVLTPVLAHGQPDAGPRVARLAARAAIDWPAFLARQDLVWRRTPTSWKEGAPLGNGHIGAMVFATTPSTLSWTLGRNDVQDRRAIYDPETGAPVLDPALASARLPIGQLEVDLGAAITNTDLRLDLWHAELRGHLTLADGRRVALRSFVHATRHVIVIELTQASGTPAPTTVRLQTALAVNERHLARRMPLDEADLNPSPSISLRDDIQVVVQPRRAGGAHAVAWQSRQTSNTHVILVSVTNLGLDGAAAVPPTAAAEAARGTIAEARATGLDALVASHRAWWHAYYPASFVSLPDVALESFYWIQMYKLASATRADGLVLDNQGPWYQRTPWPATWWNLNVQLSYWPLYAANRFAIAESLVRFVDSRHETFRRNVPAPYRGDAMGIGRMSGADGVSPMDVRGPWTPASGAYELSNLVWVMHNYWLHWQHERDDRKLPPLFDALRGSVAFLLARLEPDARGILHLPEAISPEYPGTARDTNYDLSLLRWGCQTLLALDDRLGGRHPDRTRWQHTLERLVAYPEHADGYMVGRDVPFAQSHRHFSHLLMIYPLRLVTGEAPDDRARIERSLAHWIGFEGALQGYSFVGASAMSSLLGKGEAALNYLRTLITRFVLPNTMYTESGPVIETPLAAAQAIHEMVLQSWGGIIRVFPAMPDEYASAAFDALRTQGGFQVSARRSGGRTRYVRVTSVTGEPVTLRADLQHARIEGRAEAVRAAGDGMWHLELRAGESVALLDTTASAADRLVGPVDAPGQRHPFGLP